METVRIDPPFWTRWRPFFIQVFALVAGTSWLAWLWNRSLSNGDFFPDIFMGHGVPFGTIGGILGLLYVVVSQRYAGPSIELKSDRFSFYECFPRKHLRWDEIDSISSVPHTLGRFEFLVIKLKNGRKHEVLPQYVGMSFSDLRELLNDWLERSRRTRVGVD